jgi:nitrite reductase (NADH) large subunit
MEYNRCSMKAVIIGNGVAGITTAARLRTLSETVPAEVDCQIDIYSDEDGLYYTRMRLPEFVGGGITEQQLFTYNSDWYERFRITLHGGIAVKSVDRDKKQLLLDNGGKAEYDILIFATGASPNRFPTEGDHGAGIFTLRTLADARAIKDYLHDHPEGGAVIGGGLLGLEIARAMRDAGSRHVRVFEIAPWLLPRQLDEDAAALLSKRLFAMGIEVVTGASVKSFTFDGDRVSALVLKDERSYPADAVVLSMGVHSNISLASGCGLGVNRGILTDDRMGTPDPAVFAVGDCAEFGGIVWGIIPAALEQSAVAADAAWAYLNSVFAFAPGKTEQPRRYIQTVPKTILKVAGVSVQSFGKAVLSEEEKKSGLYTVHSHTSGAGENVRYEKYVTRQNEQGEYILNGAILYGSREHQGAVSSLMNKPVIETDIQNLLEF